LIHFQTKGIPIHWDAFSFSSTITNICDNFILLCPKVLEYKEEHELTATTVTTQPQEFIFVPGQPEFGRLIVTCVTDDKYRELELMLCKPASRRCFGVIIFDGKRRTITFANAAVTNMAQGQMIISEGAPGLHGAIQFFIDGAILINGMGVRTADLQRIIFHHTHD
jgi:hypothetical protein